MSSKYGSRYFLHAIDKVKIVFPMGLRFCHQVRYSLIEFHQEAFDLQKDRKIKGKINRTEGRNHSLGKSFQQSETKELNHDTSWLRWESSKMPAWRREWWLVATLRQRWKNAWEKRYRSQWKRERLGHDLANFEEMKLIRREGTEESSWKYISRVW